jgi:hypothetical protein
MRKKNVLFLLLLVSIFIGFSCDTTEEIEKGVFPKLPVNFQVINSEFDDYNMDLPREYWGEFPLAFSSNRNSQGQDFDLIDYFVFYDYYPESNEFAFNAFEEASYWLYDTILPAVNTNYNEFGPMLVFIDNANYLFLYANDSSGNLDIKYLLGNFYFGIQKKGSFIPVTSSYNEAYPTFNSNFSSLYFCSDSTGDFDIFKINQSDDLSLINWIKSADYAVKEDVSEINSPNDDKCPFINGKLMVFTSDRAGGYGGFDLYYSVFKDGSWNAPVNFGPEINSEYDEYRPVVMYGTNYSNDLMMFSSNRTGGKGGFDIYYVGIPKMMR